ncbi:MAG: YceI family protein [Bacteroidia bacterium]|nr:YceI family protein [Bacteroidia bacterium]NNM16640.1 YceI family protein [Bacteroidia bacterium]
MRLLLICLSMSFVLAACNNQTKEYSETGEKKENAKISAAGDAYNVMAEESTVDWIGKKIGKEHEGNINISTGVFYVDGQKITGGEFVLDMNSIVNNDLSDDVMNAKLIGHLKSEDFFEVITYPTAKFELIGASPITDEDDNTHKVEGNLTIKDVTKSISFPASIHMDGGSLTATADIVFNRADWNIRYGSESHFPDLVADQIISNSIELELSIMAKK